MSLDGTAEWSLSPRESTNGLEEPEMLYTEHNNQVLGIQIGSEESAIHATGCSCIRI